MEETKKSPLPRRYPAELLEGRGRGPVEIGDRQTIEVARDLPRHVPHPVADEELLDRVEAFGGRPGRELIVVTRDLSMGVRAELRGLRTAILAEDFRLGDETAPKFSRVTSHSMAVPEPPGITPGRSAVAAASRARPPAAGPPPHASGPQRRPAGATPPTAP